MIRSNQSYTLTLYMYILMTHANTQCPIKIKENYVGTRLWSGFLLTNYIKTRNLVFLISACLLRYGTCIWLLGRWVDNDTEECRGKQTRMLRKLATLTPLHYITYIRPRGQGDHKMTQLASSSVPLWSRSKL